MTLAPERASGTLGEAAAAAVAIEEAAAGERADAPAVAEFFAGIGLVRMGLERVGFKVAWANDIEEDKAQMYRGHFRDEKDHYVVKDIKEVNADHLPNDLSLAWASFPCIDVSLAGNREGLRGEHTGTFWHFYRILQQMEEKQRPPVVVLENVTGLATSREGKDMVETVKALNRLGYSADVLFIDARHFVAQSRPRLFVVGAKQPPPNTEVEDTVLRPPRLSSIFADKKLRTHRAPLPKLDPVKTEGLADCVEPLAPDDPQWWDEKRTAAFLGSLSAGQKARLDDLRKSSVISYRTAYRRTRELVKGEPRVSMWEIRADEIAGCLRTAGGGSSKQALVEASSNGVRVRWMTAREYGNLMGARDYRLNDLRKNQALTGFGDAVCVDAIAWLAEHYLMRLLDPNDPWVVDRPRD
ncbi:DNA cytosine methyltransferase [Actinocorallia sp. API 0066]|uniref:DNA cytosine methyltransferase n=1 Tax=Actinocorallia sp. API 0066 TaxID=2896846 RepID=UPI001E2CACC8|nr:DNA cytosine methyltransferase [Actinocorallia sp. API 0066]MCD0450402.1 DNA cytosine methyltransferase [Actinocorallia sp. API 0066]